MIKTIYFDMDGTIANLYQIPQWLEKIQAFDETPYLLATTMANMQQLAKYLNKLQKNGIKLGIISWLSKKNTPDYNNRVRKAKRKWLQKHLSSVTWDEMHLIKYGTPKHLVAKDKNGILFDDNAEVRQKWKGKAYTEKEILTILKELS